MFPAGIFGWNDVITTSVFYVDSTFTNWLKLVIGSTYIFLRWNNEYFSTLKRRYFHNVDSSFTIWLNLVIWSTYIFLRWNNVFFIRWNNVIFTTFFYHSLVGWIWLFDWHSFFFKLCIVMFLSFQDKIMLLFQA